MLKPVHKEITRRALREMFGPRALDAIIAANLHQDIFVSLFGHDEFHFANNELDGSRRYIEEQRALIKPALEQGQVLFAWQALGRLTHTAQDFYAHTNYVDLWLVCQPDCLNPAPSEIDPLDDALIENPALRSGKFYYPLEAFSFIPGIKRLVIPLLPRDSHAWMNLDSANRGPMFEYALHAAIKRTKYEFDLTARGLTKGLIKVFMENP
jgi:hypothetical protein